MARKIMILLFLFAVGGVFFLAACGGGGGSGNGSSAPPISDPPIEEPPIEDPPVEDPPIEDPPIESSTTYFNFSSSAPSTGEGQGFLLRWAMTGSPIEGSAWVHSMPFSGTIHPDTGQVVLSDETICNILELSLIDNRDFQIWVPEQIVISADGQPSAGIIQVDTFGENPVAIARLRLAWPVADQVEVSYGDEGSLETTATYPLQQFIGILETEAPIQVKLASFSYSMMRFLLDQVSLLGYAIDWIDVNKDQFDPVFNGLGDAFSERGVFPPPNTPDQGEFTATWFDDNEDGEIGPGDSINLDCDMVWLDYPGTDIGYLFNGQVSFINLVDMLLEDGSRMTGFMPSEETAGGVFLDSFTEYLTFTDQGRTFIDIAYTMNGAISIWFLSH